MRVFSIVFGLVAALCLSGCAPVTTFILLPDESGKVGAITVKTPDDFRVIDNAYRSVTVAEGASGLSEIHALSEAQVNQEYANLLKAQPAKPFSFIFYFVSGSSDLVEKSRALIPQIVERIKGQMPTEVTIIGHTDTTGSDRINDELSLKRAGAVKKILKNSIPSLQGVTVRSFGSKDLLIPIKPNVDEPRNRRVEILVL